MGFFLYRKNISDEKHFCLDGSDGLVCYLHDLKTEHCRFSKLKQGDFLIMFWGTVLFYGLV